VQALAIEDPRRPQHDNSRLARDAGAGQLGQQHSKQQQVPHHLRGRSLSNHEPSADRGGRWRSRTSVRHDRDIERVIPGGLVPAVRRSHAVHRVALTVSALAVVAAPLIAQKQKPQDPEGPDQKVALTIALQVGAQRYDFTGQGSCLLIPEGSIYDAPAAMYSVRQTGAKQRFNMTMYRLKAGGDMLTMNVTFGSTTHSVSTVKVGTSGAPIGSGTVKLETAGSGGTLTIDATSAKGVKIAGTVKCDAFIRPSASNGL
jgi:hypothetical protein